MRRGRLSGLPLFLSAVPANERLQTQSGSVRGRGEAIRVSPWQYLPSGEYRPKELDFLAEVLMESQLTLPGYQASLILNQEQHVPENRNKCHEAHRESLEQVSWPEQSIDDYPNPKSEEWIDLDEDPEVIWEEDKCTHWSCLTDDEQEELERALKELESL